jgi:hypothetical protein
MKHRHSIISGPGDAAMIPPGHKIGNEPVVGIDFTNLTEDVKSK